MATEIGRSGRAGVMLGCAAACCLPMLVAVGAVSTGTAVAGGTTAGAVAAVLAVAYMVARRRAPEIDDKATLRVFTLGGALAAAGLVLSLRDGGRPAATLLVVGIAVLSCLALLRLASARQWRRPTGFE